MKKFLKLYIIEEKLTLRTPDIWIFGIMMPVGIMLLIAAIAGGKVAGGSGMTYLQASFASLQCVGICCAAFMSIPLMITDYRDKKILKHFYASPCSPAWLLGADMLCAFGTAVLSAISVAVSAVIFFQYRMPGNVLHFIGAWLLTLLAMTSIGLMMASLCRSVKTANAVTSIVYFPMLFLSGATIPYELFPRGLQRVADILPLTQGIRLMKDASMGVQAAGNTGRILLLLAIMVVCSLIAVKTFRWE